MVGGARRRVWGALCLTLLLWGCGQAPDPRVLRLGLAAAPATLDPRYATDAAAERLVRLLYARLTDFDAHARPVPSLATWVRLSPTRYRFTLDPGRAPFSDGHRLTALDVAATYRAVLDPRMASPHRGGLAVIAAIEVVDGETLDFQLERPDPLFPGHLGLGILPAAAAARRSLDPLPVGSGPFRVVAPLRNGRLVLERRRDGQRLALITVTDPTVRALKLIRGELDLLQNDLPPELADYLARRPEVRLTHAPGTTFSYLGFNLAHPLTGDRRVREAIAHAIDREAVIRHLFRGRARPAEALLPPEHWAGARGLLPYAYDPDRARALLGELGYGPQHPLRLVFKSSSDPFRLRLAAIYQAQLAAVGIRLEIRSHDWGTFFGDIKAGRFQLYGLSWVGIQGPEIFRYAFHSTSLPPEGANRGRYRSAAADRLIAAAEAAREPARRAAAYRELQALLHRDLVYLPLWYEDNLAASAADLRGYRLAPDGRYDALTEVSREPRESPSAPPSRAEP